MESLFLSLWNRSIAAGWLILVVIILRLVLKKAPKSIRPWLWALVGIRLVCPGFRESPLSLIPSVETVPQAVLARDAFQVSSGVAMFNSAVNDQLADFYKTTQVPAGHTRNFLLICAVVWLIGMAVIGLWAAVSTLRLRRRVAEAVPEGEGVWVCEHISSPFLLGLFRPRIYLPAGLDGTSRTCVLAHERAHIRRRDHLTKPLGLLLLMVYWFQPLVWAAYVLLCRDIELACDERVIAGLGAECKKTYSAALLQCSVHQGGITALAFGEVGVKERVKNVLHYKKPAFWVVAACIAAVLVAGVCFLTDPVTAKGTENQPPFYYRGIDQPDEPIVFLAGALLHQNPYLGFRPADGSFFYDTILYGGDTLTLTYGGETFAYQLDETVGMGWDNLYDYIPYLKEAEELYDAFLTDHNELVITARFYSAEDGERGPSVWTIQKENGGGQRWWLYDGLRLYALILLEDAFPFMANGVLWTYTPYQSTVLPIRFDIEGGADVFAGEGHLRLHPVEGEWVDHLTVEEGQTVYWKPLLNSEGRPIEGVGLRYYYDTEMQGEPHQWEETLTLRAVMDYASMYGGVTYGVSNNWLGAASSAVHASYITVDSETGELVVSSIQDSGFMPYMTQPEAGGVDSVLGTTEPGPVHDAQAE